MKIFQIAIFLCFIALQACGGSSLSNTETDNEITNETNNESPPIDNTPITLQLENWVSTGGSYQGFDRYPVPGGRAINFNQAGDYADYNVFLDAGTYTVSILAGTPVEETPTQVQLHLNNCLVTTSAIALSGSWGEFLDNTITHSLNVTTRAEHTLRIIGWGDPGTWQWNADYMILTRTGDHTATPESCITPPELPPNVGQLVPTYQNGSVSPEFMVTSSNTGGSYPYRIYLPNSYNENLDDYSLLVLTDAQHLFNDFIRLIDKQGRELIVVGIEDAGRRVVDYRPPGNARYIDFLFQEFMPDILEQYRADPAEVALFGQSNGGTLVGFTLLKDDPSNPIFKHLIAIDAPYAHEARFLYPLLDERKALSDNLAVNLVLTGSSHSTGFGVGVSTFADSLNQAGFSDLKITEMYYVVTHNQMASASFEDTIEAVYGKASPNAE